MPVRLPDSERTGGTPALVAALVVIALILLTVYFRESDRGPLHSVRRGVLAVTSPVASAGEWVTSPFRAVGSWFSGIGVSRQELDRLADQNAELRQRVADLEEARLENERLKSLVGFIETSEIESVGARVIGRPTSEWEGVITIDRGTADGVDAAMPVLAPQGVVGQTIEVTAHSAKVRLIGDQRSGVAAMLQTSRAEGVVKGSIEGDLTLEYVSRDTTVVVGDVVLTSGMGGVYPKGLLIGDVEAVDHDENELFPAIDVRQFADISRIEEVIVLIGAQQALDIEEGE